MKKLLVVIAVALTGCDSMSAKDFKHGEKLCEPYGGVRYVDVALLNVKAYCKDGKIIKEKANP